MDDETVGGVLDGVGVTDVGLAAVEDDGGGCEIEKEIASGVLTDHTETWLGVHLHLACVEDIGDHADEAGVGAGGLLR